jgi:hypothetical protein
MIIEKKNEFADNEELKNKSIQVVGYCCVKIDGKVEKAAVEYNYNEIYNENGKLTTDGRKNLVYEVNRVIETSPLGVEYYYLDESKKVKSQYHVFEDEGKAIYFKKVVDEITVESVTFFDRHENSSQYVITRSYSDGIVGYEKIEIEPQIGCEYTPHIAIINGLIGVCQFKIEGDYGISGLTFKQKLGEVSVKLFIKNTYSEEPDMLEICVSKQTKQKREIRKCFIPSHLFFREYDFSKTFDIEYFEKYYLLKYSDYSDRKILKFYRSGIGSEYVKIDVDLKRRTIKKISEKRVSSKSPFNAMRINYYNYEGFPVVDIEKINFNIDSKTKIFESEYCDLEEFNSQACSLKVFRARNSSYRIREEQISNKVNGKI